MKCLSRNQRPFFYARYIDKRRRTDPDTGEHMGEYEVMYSHPVPAYGNISPGRGEKSLRYFGESLNYDRVIVMNEAPFDEHSILWIDTLPTLDETGATETPHDYIVAAVARSLNSVAVAVKRVDAGA